MTIEALTGPALISVHVAKAGGSALSVAYKAAFGDRLILDYKDNPANPTSRRIIDPDGYIKNKQKLPFANSIVHGHFHPAKYNAPENTIMFTLLREPVANLISIYYFWQQMPRQSDVLHEYVIDNKLSLVEVAKLPLIRKLYSETYFGDYDMSRFNIIGKHEERDKAICALSHLISVEIDATVLYNKTPLDERRVESEHDLKLRRSLTDILRDDVEFYERWTS